jgi:hypothetical protein
MRYVLSLLLLGLCCAPLAGCGGGVTEKDKQAADKVPDLDIDESSDTEMKTEGKTEAERKGATEAEPTKP